MTQTDESWPMVEEAVFRLFEEIAGEHTAIGPKLAELGWADIESEYPVEASQLLFRAQGRSLAHTDALARAILDELAGVLDESADCVVLPAISDGCTPSSSSERVDGIVVGPLKGRVAVPVTGPNRGVSIAIVNAQNLTGQRLDTFDKSVHWTAVSGPLEGDLRPASAGWNRALAAAHRALATELTGLTERMLQIAVEQASARVQFGAPIGSFQSMRHALADGRAAFDGARALLNEAWCYGGNPLAHSAKAAAGRAHRIVAGTAMQTCGAIGLTAEHDLHRYVARGFQIDSLCGSYAQLESLFAEQLFDSHVSGRGLPPVVVCA